MSFLPIPAIAALAIALAAWAIPAPVYAQASDIKNEGESGWLRGPRPPPSPQQREARQQMLRECLARLPAAERQALLARMAERRDARRTERRQAIASLSPAERAQMQAERRRLAQGVPVGRDPFPVRLTAEQRERIMAQRATQHAQRQALGPQDRCARLLQRLSTQS